MTMIPNHCPSPQSGTTNLWHFVVKWLQITEEQWERLSDIRRADFITRIEEFAYSSIALTMINSLTPKSEQRLSSDIQVIVKLIVTISGAFTFGAGMRVIVSGLGIFAVPAGLLGGGIASLIVDRLAVEAYSNKWKQQEGQKRLDAIEYQGQQALDNLDQPKPLQVTFYHGQRTLVANVEEPSQRGTVPYSAIFAVSLSLIEYSVALWIVQNIAALSAIPLFIRAIAAALPVVLTHAAALWQTLVFEAPKHAQDRIDTYRNYLVPHPDLTDENLNHYLLECTLKDQKQDEWLTALFAPDHPEPTPKLAELNVEQVFYAWAIRQLEAQIETADQELQQQYIRGRQQLDAQIPSLSQRRPDLNEHQLAAARADALRSHQDRLQTQQQRLEDQLKEQRDQLRQTYHASIQLWQQELARAQQTYDKCYKRWEQDQSDRSDDDNHDSTAYLNCIN